MYLHSLYSHSSIFQFTACILLEIPIYQWFLAGDCFLPQPRTLAVYLEVHFWLLQVGGCYWHLVVEARDAAKHPVMHSRTPTAVVWPKLSVVLRLRISQSIKTRQNYPPYLMVTLHYTNVSQALNGHMNYLRIL